MSHGWSPSDKAVARKAAAKAARVARDTVLRRFRETRVAQVEDLWALELKLRDWRREIQHAFALNFSRAEGQLAEWLARGWLHSGDLAALSNERLKRVQQK